MMRFEDMLGNPVFIDAKRIVTVEPSGDDGEFAIVWHDRGCCGVKGSVFEVAERVTEAKKL